MLKSGKIIGTEGPENECGFSFAALSGSVVRAVGRLELGGFAARPILPRCRAAAGGPDCLSGAECGNFSGPLFFFQVQGVGRRLLTGAACYLAGPGLCAAAGAGFASPGRPGLNTAGACRFSRPPPCMRPVSFASLTWRCRQKHFSGRGGAGASDFRPLARTCGRAMV